MEKITVRSGDWNNKEVWSDNFVPNFSDPSIVISPGHTIVYKNGEETTFSGTAYGTLVVEKNGYRLKFNSV